MKHADLVAENADLKEDIKQLAAMSDAQAGFMRDDAKEIDLLKARIKELETEIEKTQ